MWALLTVQRILSSSALYFCSFYANYLLFCSVIKFTRIWVRSQPSPAHWRSATVLDSANALLTDDCREAIDADPITWLRASGRPGNDVISRQVPDRAKNWPQVLGDKTRIRYGLTRRGRNSTPPADRNLQARAPERFVSQHSRWRCTRAFRQQLNTSYIPDTWTLTTLVHETCTSRLSTYRLPETSTSNILQVFFLCEPASKFEGRNLYKFLLQFNSLECVC